MILAFRLGRAKDNMILYLFLK